MATVEDPRLHPGVTVLVADDEAREWLAQLLVSAERRRAPELEASREQIVRLFQELEVQSVFMEPAGEWIAWTFRGGVQARLSFDPAAAWSVLVAPA